MTRRTLTLTCDHCGAITRRYLAAGADEAAAERALRAELAAEGWSVDSGPDACPACTRTTAEPVAYIPAPEVAR
ncbi:hypothetical protein GV792_04830 [Nocardia cyriacigeorgica]|uniref:hypothetical protein n=1 Tax=Nocardia cyriacigeorgica TaxID=135487 RepID=UPI0013B5F36E|nr:hypothetical protein [Nocardia cyriacigeorgica]NEW49368.1 hypothetical protein [Nocardia cyriacigeorgica]